MSYMLTAEQVNEWFAKLSQAYDVYAPKRFAQQGRYSDTDLIRYAQVNSLDEIEFEAKSDFPAKEVLAPIQQTLFYFTEDEFRASKCKEKPILLFARPCDINAQYVQAKIYAGNGGFVDAYYERMRERVKYVLMECPASDDTCFCVSMGTNKTDDYAMAVHKSADGSVSVQVKDEALKGLVKEYKNCEFVPTFVEENETKVVIPEIKSKEVLNKLKEHPLWKEYNSRCIGCGACTLACSTCTCFTTKDIAYGENPEAGERRRIAASCQIDGFTTVAGGASYRPTAGDRMRFKMLHKFHDYKARFGEQHMCVGCGRCIHRCPEFISVTHTLAKMNDAVKEIEAELGGNK